MHGRAERAAQREGSQQEGAALRLLRCPPRVGREPQSAGWPLTQPRLAPLARQGALTNKPEAFTSRSWELKARA